MTLTGKEIKSILLSGILLYFSYPYFPTGFLSLIALIPLFSLIDEVEDAKRAFKVGYWFGAVFTAFIAYWIANNIIAAAIMVVFINAFYYAVLLWLFFLIKKYYNKYAYFILPFLWTAFEYTKEMTDLRFNWLNLAHTFTYYVPLIQFIEYTGYLGISFIIVFTNVSLYLFFIKKVNYGKKMFIITLILWSVVLVFSPIRYSQVKNELKKTSTLPVSYLQPNIDPWLKWEPKLQKMSLDTLFSGTKKLMGTNTKLIVWPETATPFFLKQKKDVMDTIRKWTSKNQFYLLTGTLDYKYDRNAPQKYRIYNSAFLFGPDIKSYLKYNKMNLVPGAETIPFPSVLGPLSDLVDLGQGNFVPGKKPIVFPMKKKFVAENDNHLPDVIQFGVGICYDSVFPELFRRFVAKGADFFVIITNDGWFGLTSGPFQHKQIAVLRAIEFRKSIVRCANTGISCFITPEGKTFISSQLEHFALATFDIPILKKKTFFALHGPLLPQFSLLLVCIMIFGIFYKKVKNEKPS